MFIKLELKKLLTLDHAKKWANSMTNKKFLGSSPILAGLPLGVSHTVPSSVAPEPATGSVGQLNRKAKRSCSTIDKYRLDYTIDYTLL